MADRSSAERFVLLDGLRGIAAIVIVALHATQALTQYAAYFKRAHLAVDFFFCLSGFVLAYSYYTRLQNGMSCREFMLRRIIRLAPMVLFGTSIATIAYAAKLIGSGNFNLLPDLLATSVLNILFLPSPLLHQLDHASAYLPNPPTWSLTAEMVASLVFATLLVKLSGLRLFLFLLAGAIFLAVSSASLNAVDLGWQWPTLWVGFVRVWFSFSAGVFIARIKTPAASFVGLNSSALTFIFIFALLLILCFPFDVGVAWIVEYFVVVVVFPLFVLLSVWVQGAIRNFNLLNLLGELSFPIYAVHYGVLRFFGPVRLSEWGATHSMVVLLMEIVSSCGVAWLALVFFDRPIRGFLTSHWLSRGERRPMPSFS